jgi:hypothetical protein
MNKSRGYEVYLGGKLIDTVFYTHPTGYTAQERVEDVRKSLIDHDGYDPRIRVKCDRKTAPEES